MKRRHLPYLYILLALVIAAAYLIGRGRPAAEEPYVPLAQRTPSPLPVTPTLRATRPIRPTGTRVTPQTTATPGPPGPLEADAVLMEAAGALRSGQVWVAAPDGSPDGDGSAGEPWDIETALEMSKTIEPGDTLYLRGGRYGDGGRGRLITKLYGELGNPIVVRPYPGEWAVIDANLEIYGRHTWFWGLEITNSSPDRHVATNLRPPGMTIVGQSIYVINNVIHNTGHPGIGYWESYEEDPGEHGEVYGNLIWGVGLYDASTKLTNSAWERGSGMYLQNINGTRRIEQNITFFNFATGMKVYAEDESSVNGFQVIDNVIFANDDRPFLASGDSFPFHGLEFSGNLVWRDRSSDKRNVEIGYASSDQSDAVIRDNYIVGGRFEQCALSATHVQQLTVTGNTVIGGLCLASYQPAAQPGEVTWADNEYYGSGMLFGKSGRVVGLERWKGDNGFDGSSSFSEGLPEENAVFVRANKYEPGRGYAVIFNWEGLQRQAVDLSSVLQPGQAYRIVDAQNFFGPAVAEGVFDEAPVELPLGLQVVSALVGEPLPFVAAHTSSEFNAFVILPQ